MYELQVEDVLGMTEKLVQKLSYSKVDRRKLTMY